MSFYSDEFFFLNVSLTGRVGLREVFLYLAKEKRVDVIVAPAGAIEADLLRCLAPTYIGSFSNSVYATHQSVLFFFLGRSNYALRCV